MTTTVPINRHDYEEREEKNVKWASVCEWRETHDCDYNKWIIFVQIIRMSIIIMGLDSVFASSKIIRNKTMAQSVNKAKRMDEWNERAQILIG